MGFDHHNALDVTVHPDSPEAWGALEDAVSGAPLHVGQPSSRFTVEW